jgi:hypothetical protein
VICSRPSAAIWRWCSASSPARASISCPRFLAIAHKLIVCVYHMLSTTAPYRELGEDYFDKRDTQRATRRYVRRLRDLGFSVMLQPRSQLQPAAANAL